MPSATGGGHPLRLLTCNIHGKEGLDVAAVASLLAAEGPDIVALQEYGPQYADSLFASGGWNVVVDGELCVASRFPLRRVGRIQHFGRSDIDYASPPGCATRFEVMTPAGVVPLINVHLASPHWDFRAALRRESDGAARVARNSARRLSEATDLRRHAGEAGEAVILAGDFNTMTDSTVYRQTLTDFPDAFATAGFGFGLTYLHGGAMARIDHVLTGSGWRCRQCRVGPNVGSPRWSVIWGVGRERVNDE
jgi:endonuclease/exonuclease/phosphatase family metal-dependent hydrolase